MKCWLSHDWTQWSGVYEFGMYHYERRMCRRCGATGQRAIGVAARIVGQISKTPPRKLLPGDGKPKLVLVGKDSAA